MKTYLKLSSRVKCFINREVEVAVWRDDESEVNSKHAKIRSPRVTMGRFGVCQQCPRRSTARERSSTNSALSALTLRGKCFFDRARRFHSRQRHFKYL